ncbi:hypothetical protein ACNI3K_01530 [Demequina sp. SO4-13]|uniref:hypothetical protein n=1 Tax=Demequina sp. SO4-13 TaxID=3401027 RepID=UPI003AF6F209
MAGFRVEHREAVAYIAVPVHTTMAAFPARVGEAFAELDAYLAQRGAETIGAGAIRYRSVALDATFTVEVAHAVVGVPKVRDRNLAGRFEAGTYAVAEQHGPYAWIGGLTRDLMDWGDSQGLDFAMTPGDERRPDVWDCWYEYYPGFPVEGPRGLEGNVQVCVLLRT